MFQPPRRTWAPLIALACFAVTPAIVRGSALLTINAKGPGNFLVVDQTSGTATSVAPNVAMGSRTWVGLATVPGGDPTIAYALQNPPPPNFEDSPKSRLARIDTRTGTATMLPYFDPNVLGSPGPVSTAISISSLEPGVATIVAFEKDDPGDRLLFKVNLETGEVLGPALVLPKRTAINALAYSPDGHTLYATDEDGALALLNPTTGVLTRIGDPAGLSPYVTGLAFRPEDHALFAIDALFNDRLVRLNPLTGASLGIVGSLGIDGPSGLAFAETDEPFVAGDTNADGRVDIADLNAVRNNFGAAGVQIAGDADGDALVGIADLNLVRNNFGAVGGAPAPEPASMTIATLTTLALLCFHWRGMIVRRPNGW